MKKSANRKGLGAFRLIVFLLAIFQTDVTFSQSRFLDSLLLKYNTYASYQNDSMTIVLLNKIAFEYRNNFADSSLWYAKKAYHYSDSLGIISEKTRSLRNMSLAYIKKDQPDTAIFLLQSGLLTSQGCECSDIEADIYNSLGTAWYFKSEFDSAIFYFEKSIESFLEKDNQESAAGTMINLGVIYENTGKFSKALENYHNALNVFEALDVNISGKAIAYYNAAKLYAQINWFDKAEEYYLKVASLDSLSGDVMGIASTMGSLANIYLNKNDTAKAIDFYRYSIDLYTQTGAGKCRAIYSLGNLGEIYQMQGNYDSAFYFIQQALQRAEECQLPKELVFAALKAGSLHFSYNDFARAQSFFQKAFEEASSRNFENEIAGAASYLYKLYRKQGNQAEALKFLEIENTIKNELYSDENTRILAIMEGRFEIEKEMQQLQFENSLSELQLKKELQQEKTLRLYFLIFVILLSILLFAIVWLYVQRIRDNKQLDKINREMSDQNKEIARQRDLLQEKSHMLENQSLEIRRNNENLKKLNEEKNSIIGIVAHDLKSPLNQIKGLIALLSIELRKTTIHKDLAEYIERIKTASEQSVEMIDRILDISAIEAEKMEIKPQKIEADIIIREVAEAFTEQARDKNMKILLDLTPEIRFYTDPLYLREILNNLISNAIKFSPPFNVVEVYLTQNPEYYKIEIKDTGPGISPEDQKSMYYMFKKASNMPTQGEKSTGLGLAIVRKYCDALDYKLSCISSLGEGTTFEINIPVLNEQEVEELI
ncbi:MAG: tetratricopeptide repeat protein [Cyclobacteriaceae bacterium]|nr:tetratricopeptide repeat protein [Cyclobacteriaceae bacterium]